MSEFKFSCPGCGQHIQVSGAYAGRQVNCPSCQIPLVVPEAPAAPTPRLAMASQAPSPSRPDPTFPRLQRTVGSAPKRSGMTWVIIGSTAALFVFASTILYQKFFALNTDSRVANRLVKLINAADYSGIENLFNKQMTRTLPLEKTAEFFEGLNARVGKIQTLDKPETNSTGLVFPAHCERGMLDMVLALDRHYKIAGLLFKPPMDPHTKLANRIVELINAADYSDVENLFNQEMSQALPLEKATEFFKGLSAQAGKIQRLDEPETNSEGLVFPVHCDRGVLDMTLALDEHDKIAGLVFRPPVDRNTKVANRILELFNAEDYSGIENLFNEDMSKALPLKKGTGFFTRLNEQVGKIQKLDEPKRNAGWTVFPAHFERGILNMSLVLDDDNKIAGLNFKPAGH